MNALLIQVLCCPFYWFLLQEAVSDTKALKGSKVPLLTEAGGKTTWLNLKCAFRNISFSVASEICPSFYLLGKFSPITPVYAVSVSMRYQWWWPFGFLLVGRVSEPADGDMLTRTGKKIIEKRMGDKCSLQCQGNLWTASLSPFLGQMLALLGNNSAGMESNFVKEHVHGRMWWIWACNSCLSLWNSL